jgi:hypothetical protein
MSEDYKQSFLRTDIIVSYLSEILFLSFSFLYEITIKTLEKFKYSDNENIILVNT